MCVRGCLYFLLGKGMFLVQLISVVGLDFLIMIMALIVFVRDNLKYSEIYFTS